MQQGTPKNKIRYILSVSFPDLGNPHDLFASFDVEGGASYKLIFLVINISKCSEGQLIEL